MQMLLEAGADARAMDINGCAPIQYLLKVTDVRPMAVPELCFQLLLNHNAARVYPPQFHKVLQSCHDYPRVIEVLVNSYERLKPTRKWTAAIPHDCYQVDHPSRAVPGIMLDLNSGGFSARRRMDFCSVMGTLIRNQPTMLSQLILMELVNLQSYFSAQQPP